MEFLDGPGLRARLRALVAGSKRVRMAVAFWGEGVVEELGLQDATDVQVVCNLRMGGTNPREIEKLRRPGVEIRHSDTLHAKMYLFDDRCVVGSSNASANGLSFQGGECSGWTEANVMFGSGAAYEAAERKYRLIWASAREVTDSDLDQAETAWTNRRRAIPSAPPNGKDKESLLQVLRRDPGQLADRRIYLCVHCAPMSQEGADIASEEVRASVYGRKLGAYEHWENAPKNVDLVSFYLGSRGGFYFDGYWRMPKQLYERRTRKTSVQFCFKLKDICGLKEPGPSDEWKVLIKQVRQSKDWDEANGGAFIEIGEFARRYLRG
jgi:hypothetical protein